MIICSLESIKNERKLLHRKIDKTEQKAFLPILASDKHLRRCLSSLIKKFLIKSATYHLHSLKKKSVGLKIAGVYEAVKPLAC